MKKGLVLGINLNNSEPLKVCELCKYVKMTQKPIQHECEGKHAKNIGDEVHMDIWGASPVETM